MYTFSIIAHCTLHMCQLPLFMTKIAANYDEKVLTRLLPLTPTQHWKTKEESPFLVCIGRKSSRLPSTPASNQTMKRIHLRKAMDEIVLACLLPLSLIKLWREFISVLHWTKKFSPVSYPTAKNKDERMRCFLSLFCYLHRPFLISSRLSPTPLQRTKTGGWDVFYLCSAICKGHF